MHGPTYMANALHVPPPMPRLTCSSKSLACVRWPILGSHWNASWRPAVIFARQGGARKGRYRRRRAHRIDDLDGLRARFVEEGVFIRPIGNIVYLTPAFTITAAELKILTDAVVKVVRDLR